ncbi:helix-turn-helix domain-containing protein [uncultured Chitinophaga sp.]|jgi:AraC-type DNA-binding domain-containing proteins|uniref:helix-turn-helix domain-containing protein n=1 Tax=uncultured Chitinophaga sp. TaxID=339340 RepID=UPI0026219D91|nr:helix-turn-helix domain-containing protein [uncultured Chitinophaga sp.]
MKGKEIKAIHIASIAQSHQALDIGKPRHPLFSILRIEDLAQVSVTERTRLTFDFYQVVLKKECPTKVQYGQTMYDFDEGVMSFFAPRQVTIVDPGDLFPKTGWILNIHPDFLRAYPLGQKIKEYGFFEYAVNEALILSEEEQQSVEHIFQQIEQEYRLAIDHFSQDVLIANLELLFTYANRYYNRQFIVRKPGYHGLLAKLEDLLNTYFETEVVQKGLPTVSYLATTLHLSPKYLSDVLKQLTGLTAQQHIHEKLIEKAKEKLAASGLSVSEIAYELGFERPQSFSKFFKEKTSQSPMAFRARFN